MHLRDELRELLPAYAGVILRRDTMDIIIESAPRVCGGDPYT